MILRLMSPTIVLGLLLLFVEPAGSAPTAVPPPSVPDIGYEGNSISRLVGAGVLKLKNSESHRFPIDVMTPASFLLISSPGELELVVESPTGKRWSSHDLKDGGGHLDSILGMAPGGMSMVDVEEPEPGEWTARIIARSMPDTVSEVAYLLKLLQNTGEHGPVLHSLVPDRPYNRGETVLVRASLLKNGRPVPGAEVRVAAGFFGDIRPVAKLNLRDDGITPDSLAGDGVWSGTLPPIPRGGLYEMSIGAERKAGPGAPAFSRTISQTLRTTRTTARLTGRNSDFLRDSDGDGMPDRLVVRMGLHLEDPDSLGMFGYLSGAKGTPQFARTDERLFPAGDGTIDLEWELEDLVAQCGPGVFSLDSLVFFEMHEPYGALIVVEEPTNVHRTREYSRDELVYEPIHATREARVTGIDADHDGKYEILAVDVDLVLKVAGLYAWSFNLSPSDDMMPPQGSGVTRLPAGHTALRLEIPGACFARMPRREPILINELTMNYVPRTPVPALAPRGATSARGIALQGVPPGERFDPRARDVRSREVSSPDEYSLFHCPE